MAEPDRPTRPTSRAPTRYDRRRPRAADTSWPAHRGLEGERQAPVGGTCASAWLAPWTPGADALVVVAVLAAATALLGAPRLPADAAALLATRVPLGVALGGALAVAWATTALRVVGAYAHTRAAREVLADTVAGGAAAAAPALLVHAGGAARLLAALAAWACLTAGLFAVRAATYRYRRARRAEVRLLVAGTGPRAHVLWERLRADPTVSYQLVAVADTPGALAAPGALGVDAAGRGGTDHGGGPAAPVAVAVDQVERFLMHAVVDEVVVALPLRSCFAEVRHVLGACERVGVHARYLAEAVEPGIARARADLSGGFPAVSLHVAPDDWRLVLKRTLDVAGALAGLAVLAPFFALIALAVRLSGPGPVFFAQERYGHRKRRFRMWKFRTMVVGAEALQDGLEALNEAGGPVFKIARDPRVTRVGAWLRRTSVDELPQLWNVLRGEMSLVGPRPLPARDVARFAEPWLMRRFSMRPGLTCLWQVSGRSQVGFEEWVRLDLRYIDRWSLALDCRILLRTLPAVLHARGAY